MVLANQPVSAKQFRGGNQLQESERAAVLEQSPDLMFADYLTHEPDEEGRYELADGRLVTMPPPTWMHLLIAKFLVGRLDQAIAEMGKADDWTTLQEPGQRTGGSCSRLPDVAIVPFEQMEDFLGSAVLQVPAPLVVEIVSGNWRDDYLVKLAEYEELGILEYWIVDYQGLGGSRYIGSPKQPTVSVYRWLDGEYQVERFGSGEAVVSAVLPHLSLAVADVISAGRG